MKINGVQQPHFKIPKPFNLPWARTLTWDFTAENPKGRPRPAMEPCNKIRG